MIRTAVVTGGAGAIGRAVATAFADSGAEVHVVDLSPETEVIAAEVGGIAHVLDVTDPDELAELSELTSVDVLVNGAGAWERVTLDELTPDAWRSSVDLNLNSSFFTTWACRAALRRSRGVVVNVASAIAFKGHAEMAHYVAAKAGMIGMTKALAMEFGQDGVRVNAVAPGLVNTARNTEIWGDRQAAMSAARALPLDLTVDDVVRAILYLTSGDARMMTGQTVVVDGGGYMH